MKGDNMKNKKRNKLDPVGNLIRYGSFSAKWTALFALIAIFSVMVLGVTQVSFAAGPVEYPDELTDSRISSVSDYTGDWFPHGQIKLKYAKANGVEVPVYCLEEWKQYGDHDDFERTDSKTYLTPGVVAILTYANSNPGLWNKNLADDIEGTKQQQAITQLAIWAYLYDTNEEYKKNSTEMAKVYDKLMDETGAQNGNFGQWVTKLVKYGKEHEQEYVQPTASISGPNGEFQLSDDQQYMISPEMTLSVSPAETLQSFKLGLENAPEGTKVVVDGGTEYDASQLASQDFTKDQLGMKVKVKVPKDKLTEESKTFNLTISAVNKYFVGWEYKRKGKGDDDTVQRIAAGTIATPESKGSVSLTASYKVDVPKTAQNSSVMLYIVGLIVLLSGVGVIYANVKPAKQK